MRKYYIISALLAFCLSIQSLGAEMQISPDSLLKTPSFPQIQQSDFIIPDYLFRNGERLSNVKIHYYTLGSPKKNEQVKS